MGRSVAQLHRQYVGKRLAYSDPTRPGVVWFCRCTDVRMGWGELLLLQPEAGEGSFLATAGKCQVIGEVNVNATASSGQAAQGRLDRTGGREVEASQ